MLTGGPQGVALEPALLSSPPYKQPLGFQRRKSHRLGLGSQMGQNRSPLAIDPEFLWDPKMSELAWKFPLCVRKTHLSLPSAELCCGRPYPSLGSSRWKDAPVGEEAEAFLR